MEGQGVQIQGSNLTETTAVAFNGVPANFIVVSSYLIYRLVPAGATSGPIQVTTPHGVVQTTSAFQVLP
jgi:hypothetical protein